MLYVKIGVRYRKNMTSVASRQQVEQVMLHEIAHALLPPSVKHGFQWKVLAKKIGYIGGRTANNPYQQPSRKVSYTPKFGVKVGDRLRLSNGEVVVVERAARKYFYLKSVASDKWWKIPLISALVYKI